MVQVVVTQAQLLPRPTNLGNIPQTSTPPTPSPRTDSNTTAQNQASITANIMPARITMAHTIKAPPTWHRQQLTSLLIMITLAISTVPLPMHSTARTTTT